MDLGSYSFTAVGLMTFNTGNRPRNLGANFLDSTQRGRSRVESLTAVSCNDISVHGGKEGGLGLCPSPSAAANISSGRGAGDVGTEGRKQRRLIAVNTLKGDSPVAKLRRELWTYSIHTNWEDHEEGSRDTMQLRANSISWFFLSVWPLD